MKKKFLVQCIQYTRTLWENKRLIGIMASTKKNYYLSGKSFLPARVAAQKLACAPDYVGKLCRDGKLDCARVDGAWLVEETSMAEFEKNRRMAKIVRAEELSLLRQQENTLRRKMLSTKHAAQALNCAPDYIGKLCREGKLEGTRVRNAWFVSADSLARFEAERDYSKALRAEELRNLRRSEIEEYRSAGEYVHAPEEDVWDTPFPQKKYTPQTSNNFTSLKGATFVFGVIFLFSSVVFAGGGFANTSVVGQNVRQMAAALAQLESPFFGTRPTAIEFQAVENKPSFFTRFFAFLFEPSAPKVADTLPVRPVPATSAPAQQGAVGQTIVNNTTNNYTTTNNNTNNNTSNTYNNSSYTIASAAPDGSLVTKEFFDKSLERVFDAIGRASDGNGGGGISTITDADVPDDITASNYLALSGGTLTGAVNNTATGTSTFSGGLSVNTFAVSSGATSTFGGGVNIASGCFSINGACLGATTVGGSNGQIQFNNGGVLGGSSSLTFDSSTGLLGFGSAVGTAATTTSFFSTTSSSTNLFTSNFSIGSLTGLLQANNGLVTSSSTLSVAYGGTGTSTAPVYGSLLVGNGLGGYSFFATSSLGITPIWGNIGGTLSNQADLQTALDSKLSLTTWFATTTDVLDEGLNNLYFTQTRARGALSGASVIAYDNTTGVITTQGGTFGSGSYIFPSNMTVNGNSSLGTVTSGIWNGSAIGSTYGGTGITSVTQNQLLIGAGGNAWTQISTSSLGIALSDTIGTLSVARGGTGSTTLTGLLVGNGAGSLLTATLSSPLSFSGSTLSITEANSSTDGYLSSPDWSTFQNKISSSSLSGGSGISYNSTTGVISSTVAFPFTPQAWGNSTSTLIGFNNGILVNAASSTIAGALNITGSAYFTALTSTLLSTDNSGAAQATTVSSPLSFSGSTLSIAQANSLTNGYLSNTDWSLFNNKISSTSIDTSLELATLLTDETGSGSAVFSTDARLSSTTLLASTLLTNATSTTFNTGLLGVGGSSYFTSLLGTGLTNTSGALTVTLAPFSTTNLSEGSNLYFTDVRVGTYIASSSTIPHIGGTAYGDLLRWTGSAWTTAATSTLGVALSDTTGTLTATRGGTGLSSFTTGDILYADSGSTLTRLPVGSAGQVLKVQAGLPSWGVDQTIGGGGGSDGIFATSSGKIYPLDTASVVLVGTEATSTANSIFEVSGQQYISTRLAIATTAPSVGAALAVGGSGYLTGGLGVGVLNTNAGTLQTSGNAAIGGSLTLDSALAAQYGGTGSTTLTGLLVGNGTGSLLTATVSGPLAFSGSTLSITQANSSTNGYLSSSDWTTFNNKISSSSLAQIFPFTPQAWGNSTSTLIGFNNGILVNAASSTITGGLTLNGALGISGAITSTATTPNTLPYASTTAFTASGTGYFGNIINNGLSANQLVYTNNSKQEVSVATSTATLASEFTYGGTLGSLVGGASGTLSLTTNGVALTKLAQIAANSVLVNNTSATGNVTAISTSTLFGTGTGGQVLTWNAGQPQWVATNTYAGANGLTTSFSNNTLTITGVNAAADGATKGVAAFTAADFDASSGLISIDYTNGQAASASNKGFLTFADWTTFNNKISSSSLAQIFPFTSTTNFGAAANSTSTPIWFTNGLMASSTSRLVYASSTALTVSGTGYFGVASTTNLTISSVASGSLLKTTTGGAVTAAVAGTDYATPAQISAVFPFTATTFGSTNANATSTLIGFNNGIYALASSTIGGGTQITGLTISGGATTTGNAYFGGTGKFASTLSLVGVLSCTGGQALQTNASGDISCGTISISGASIGGGWSTNNLGSVILATTSDRVGIGATSTPYAKLSVMSGAVGTTTLALLPFAGQTANILDIYNTSGALSSVFTSSGRLGLGTTSPSQTLSVDGGATISGNLGLGTTSPYSKLSVVGGNITQVASGAPTFATSTPSGDVTYLTYVAGNYAYVADNGGGLKILDVTNPKKPTVAGTYSAVATVRSVVVAGKYAYVADSDTGLNILDVSNPSSPTLVGVYAAGGRAFTIALSGRYVYMPDVLTGTLRIVDVADPTNPTLVGSYVTNGVSGEPYAIAVSGKYAYLGDQGTNRIYVLDISNPTNPTLVSSYTSGVTAPTNIYLSGKYAYVSDAGGGFYILDTSNPAALSLVGSYNTSASYYAVQVAGGYAYVADNVSGTVVVLDVSNVTSPTLVGAYSGGTAPRGIFISGKYVYVADLGGGLKVLDINGIQAPTASIGAIQTSMLNVADNINVGGDIYAGGGLNVGLSGIFSRGGLASFGSSTLATTTVSTLNLTGLNGVLQATNGRVSATSTLSAQFGGTGSTTLTGLLVGNGTGSLLTATVSGPLAFSGSTLSITQANSSTNGYLSSSDWTTFNNKISSSSLAQIFPFTPQAWGNSTSTLIGFNNGILVNAASSTITGGLTLNGALGISGAITSTATAANTFPYASTTALTVSGNAYFPGSGIWNSSGNVGIGTTSPAYPLHIATNDGDIGFGDITAGTITTDAGFILTGNGTTTSALFTEVDGKILSYGINVSQITTRDTSTAGGIFRFDTRTSGGFGNANNFVVKAYPVGSLTEFNALVVNLNTGDTALAPVSGNVGIGTTSPGQKLSVAGDILGNRIIGSYFTSTSTTASTFAGIITSTATSYNTFPYASTTALTVSGSTYLTSLTNSVLATDPTGKIIATTSIGINNLSGVLPVANGGTGSTTLSGILVGNGTGAVQTLTVSSPLTFSGSTLSIQNAAADGSTKGAASFTAADFDATSGNISIDYTNAQKANASQPGFLTFADWSTFNNKISSTSLSAGAGISYNSTTGVITNTIGYLFPSNATTTQIAFNGGLTAAGATTTALAVTGSTTVASVLNVGGALTANSTLSVAGTATFANIINNGLSANQLVYTNNSKQEVSVATSTATLASEFTYGGTLGALVGGSSGTLSLTTNGVAVTKLAQIAANSVLVNNTSATGNVTAIATSTFFGTGTGGQVLTWNNGQPSWVATTTFSGSNGITTSFAAGALTITGTNAAADGSTKGVASFTAADFDATSGNISIDYTSAQKANASQPGFLTFADWSTFNNKISSSSLAQIFPFTPTTNFGANTNATTSPIWFQSGIQASSTLKISGAITSAATSYNTFPYASTTALTVSGNAYFPGTGIWNSSGNVGIGTTTPVTQLDIENMSATSTFRLFGANSYGAKLSLYENANAVSGLGGFGFDIFYDGTANVLSFTTVDNGTPTLEALTLRRSNGNVGIGTSTPGQKLSVAGDILGNNIIGSYFTSTSTTASTFAGIITSTATSYNTFPYASTTALTVSGSTYLTSLTNSVLATDPTGKIIATTSIGINNLSGVLPVANGGTGSTTLSGILVGNGTSAIQTLAVSSPLTFSGSTLAIQNAAADGSTKGAASFTAADFDASSGLISIDYTNGQAASASQPGFLTSADWSTFNNKISSSSLAQIFPFTPQAWGNSTSTLIGFNNGILVNAASSTITGGLTLNGALGISGAITSTATSYNTFPYASTTALTVGGNAYFPGSGIWNSSGVGIGTTTPGTLLTINGVANFGLLQLVSSNTNGESGLLIKSADDTNGGTGTWRLGKNMVLTSDAFELYNGSTGNVLTALTSGNVGIGTTTPVSLLNVAGATAPKITISDTNASADQKHWFMESSSGVFSVGTTSDALATNATYRAFAIDAAGEVGIGTVAPVAKLQVEEGAAADAAFGIYNSSSGNGYLAMSANLSAGAYNGLVAAGDKALIFTNGSQDTGNLVIAPWGTSSYGIKMLGATGLIGVNKQIPTYSFDVTGNARFTSLVDASRFVATSTTASSFPYASSTALTVSGTGYFGTANVSGLTASRLVATDANKNLASTITLANLASSISDVTGTIGTGNLVLSIGPTFTGTANFANIGISGNSTLGTVTSGIWNGSAIGGTYGGTGLTSVTQNSLLIGGAGNTWTQTATSSLGIAISDTIGTLSVARGGTGATTLTGLLIGNGTSAVTATTLSSGISGQLSDETGSGSLVFSVSPTFTGGARIDGTVTLGGGTGSTTMGLNQGFSAEFISLSSTSVPYMDWKNWASEDYDFRFQHDPVQNRFEFHSSTTQNVLSINPSNVTIPFASTTALTVSGNAYFPGSGIWNSSGDVGIGSTTPTNKLTLVGGSMFQAGGDAVTSYTPTTIGGVDLGVNTSLTTGGRTVSVIGNTAYIVTSTAAGAGGCSASDQAGCEFRIYDVSTSTPKFLSGVDIKNGSAADTAGGGVFVAGNYAYITNNSATGSCLNTSNSNGCEFRIYDISNPTNPVQVGGLDLPNTARGVMVVGRYAYVTTSSATTGFRIIDISNPTNPTTVSVMSLGAVSNGVYVQGNYAYLASDSGTATTFQIIDISNPVAPTTVSGLQLGVTASTVYVSGNYAYVGLASGTGGDILAVYDVSNPAAIATTTTVSAGNAVSSIYVSGRYAYVGINSASGNDMRIYDVSDPYGLVNIGGADVSTNAGGVFVSGKRIFLQKGNSGITNDFVVYDASGLEVQSLLAHSFEAGNAQVRDSLTVGGVGQFGSLNIGQGGVFSRGPLSVFMASTTATNPVSASFMGGNVGIGTTSPYSMLSVAGQVVAQNFIATSTTVSSVFPYASTTALTVSGNAYFPGSGIWNSSGDVGIGTTTPGSLLSLGGIANFTTATSTFYSSGGLNLSGGCYAIGGTCLTVGSFGGTLAITNGGTNATTQTTNGVNYFNGTSITSGTDFNYNGTNVGIGSTSPSKKLTVLGSSVSSAIGQAPVRIGVTTASSVGLELGTYGGGFAMLQGLQHTTNAAGMVLLNPFGGSVGVGTTTNSDYTFSVTGTNYVTGATTLGSTLALTGAATFSSTLGISGAITSTATTPNTLPYASTTALTVSGNAYFPGSGIWNSSGRVGIGTTTPAVDLDVNGAIRASNISSMSAVTEGGQFTLGWTGAFLTGQGNRSWNIDSDSSDNLRIFKQDATGATAIGISIASTTGKVTMTYASTTAFSVSGASYFTGTMTAGAANFSGAITSTATAANTFPYASTTALTVSGDAYFPGSGIWNSSGNVGIGTNAPTSKLHVAGGTDSQIRNTATAGSSWFIGTNVSSYILHNESNTPMLLTTNSTERMRIEAAGNVGIGTTTPGQKLSVAGDILGNNIIGSYFTSTSTTASTFAGIITSTATSYNTFPYASTTALTVSGNAYFPGSGIWNSSGNVGIGTTTPGFKLGVVGSAWFGGVTASYRSAAFDTNGLLTLRYGDNSLKNILSIDNGSIDAVGNGAGMVFNLGTGNTLSPENAAAIYGVAENTTHSGATADGALVIRTAINGTLAERMRITSTGAVGIGTTTVDIAGTTLDTLVIGTASAINAGIVLDLGAAGTGGYGFAIDGTINSRISYSAASKAMSFLANSLTAQMTLVSSGNVGIGITAPENTLQISTTSAGIVTNGLLLQNRSSTLGTGVSLNFISSATSFSNNRYNSITSVNTDGSNGQALTFSTSNSAAPVERMRITAAGNVGIGTSTPGQKLSVAGDILGNRIIGSNFISTSTTASTFAGIITSTATAANTFPYASTTALTVSGDAYFPGSGIWNSSGNVGIGTNAPTSKLHVAGGTDSQIRNTATAGSSWFIGTNVSSYILHNESNTPMLLTTNSTERMRIEAAGNVGIGTTTPGQKLSVAGDILGNNIIGSYFTSTSTTASTFAGIITSTATSYNTFPYASTTAITASGQFFGNTSDAVSTPAYSWGGDTTTGIYNSAASQVGIAGAGSQLANFKSGTTTLNVMTGIATLGEVRLGRTDITTRYNTIQTFVSTTAAASYINFGVHNGTVASDYSSINNVMMLRGDGNIGMSTTSPFAKFSLHANNGDTNKALFAIASSTATATTTLFSVSNTGAVGIATTTSTTTILTVGNSGITGSVAAFGNATGICFINPTTTSLSCSSDERLKKNITTLSPSLTGILALNPVTYNWNTETDSTAVHSGFIAQQVEPIFSDLVMTDSNNMKSMNYAGLTPYLVSAIKEINGAVDVAGALTGSSTIRSVYAGTDVAAISIDANGNIGLGAYGAGVLVTDDEGNVTASTEITERIGMLESLMGQLQSMVSTTVATSGEDVATSSATTTPLVAAFTQTLLEALSALGVTLENGIIHFMDLFADHITTNTLTVGSTERPAGITLFDKVTGEPYCFEVINGEGATTPGECVAGDLTAEPDTESQTQTDVGTSTPITTEGGEGEVATTTTEMTDEGVASSTPTTSESQDTGSTAISSDTQSDAPAAEGSDVVNNDSTQNDPSGDTAQSTNSDTATPSSEGASDASSGPDAPAATVE